MSKVTSTKTCGRDAACDLVVEHHSVSPVHAHIELSEDGLVRVLDLQTGEGVFLNRNDNWIRVKRATLCIGDLIRLGEFEVPLVQFMSMFDGSRLESRHFPPRSRQAGFYSANAAKDRNSQTGNPRRNALTGKIEDTSSV